MEKLGDERLLVRRVRADGEVELKVPIDANHAAVDVEREKGGRERFSSVGGRSIRQVVL